MMRIPQDVRRQTTKKKIIGAAIRLLSANDYHRITSKDIAKEAGISTGSFYTYFDNKKEILVEILNEYLRNARIGTAEDGQEKSLREIIGRCFVLHDFPPGFGKNIAMLSLSDPDVQRMYNDYENAMIGEIQCALRRYIPEIGDSRLEAAGIIIFSAVKGAIHRIKFNGCGLDQAEIVNELVAFVSRYIAGSP